MSSQSNTVQGRIWVRVIAGLLLALISLSILIGAVFSTAKTNPDLTGWAVIGFIGLGLVGSAAGWWIMLTGLAKRTARITRLDRHANDIAAQAIPPHPPTPAPSKGGLIVWLVLAAGVFIGLMLLLNKTTASFSGGAAKYFVQGLLVVILVILLPASRQLRIPRQLEDTKEAGRWLAILVGVIVIESFALWGYQALAGAVPKSIAPGLKLPIMAVLGAVMLFILFVPLGLVALAARIWINRTLGQADYDRALSRAQTAAKLIPFQFGNVLFGPEQGRILLTAAHYDEAEAALYAALEKGQEAGTAGNVQYECLDLLGQVMLEQERFDEAIQCLEGAIDIRPDQSAAYDSLAGVYLWMGDQPGQALELTKQALTLYKPRRLFGRVAAPAMWMNRAWALAQLRRDKANEAYDRAFALMKSESKPALADLHCRAGAVCYGQGDMDTATHHFEQAIQLDPTGRAGQLARRALQAEQ